MRQWVKRHESRLQEWCTGCLPNRTTHPGCTDCGHAHPSGKCQLQTEGDEQYWTSNAWLSNMIPSPGDQWGGGPHPDFASRNVFERYADVLNDDSVARFITPGGQMVEVRVKVSKTNLRIHYNTGGEH